MAQQSKISEKELWPEWSLEVLSVRILLVLMVGKLASFNVILSIIMFFVSVFAMFLGDYRIYRKKRRMLKP
jgi:hypothetical protein